MAVVEINSHRKCCTFLSHRHTNVQLMKTLTHVRTQTTFFIHFDLVGGRNSVYPTRPTVTHRSVAPGSLLHYRS